MAATGLPNISFTNNLGTIVFQRAMLEITDEWSIGVGPAQHGQRIRVNGAIYRADMVKFSDMVPDDDSFSGAATFGTVGILRLPWKDIPGVMLRSIDSPTGTWVDPVTVSAEFSIPDPDLNYYEVDFFGISLLNARLSVGLPYRQIKDAFVQMPLESFSPPSMIDPFYGPIRVLETADNMTVELTGTWSVPPRLDLGRICQLTSRRLGTSLVPNLSVGTAALPNGYPHVFDLANFNPTWAARMPLRHLWVTGSTLNWDVERSQMEMTISMECPPQTLEVSP